MNRAYRCVLAALAACGAALASAQKIDPAEWAPPEAVVFLGVTSVSDAWAAFETTGQYRLLSDPLMRELSPEWSVTMQFAERFRERLARLLDVEPEKLTNPFSGPVAAWLVRGEGDDSELGGVLMAGYSDREQMRSYYDKLLARLRQ